MVALRLVPLPFRILASWVRTADTAPCLLAAVGPRSFTNVSRLARIWSVEIGIRVRARGMVAPAAIVRPPV